MSAPIEYKPVLVSRKLYERLLAVYPNGYRREYGSPMAQLFRDQCRDAWRESRSWGLLALWLRVLPDLVKTSFLEHLSSLKGRKSMADKISEVTNFNPAPLKTFLGVFVVVFLLVFGASVVITFLMPESYRSTARIKVERNPSASAGQNGSPVSASGHDSYDPYFLQTEFEVIQSQVVLGKVIETLNLNTAWGKKYAGGEKLKTAETLSLVKARLDLRPIRNTSLIEISVYGEDRDETARIANAIAEVYREHRLQQQSYLAEQKITALQEQFVEQEQKVRDAQKQVDQLRKELNITDLEATGNSPAPPLDAVTVRRLQGELITSKTLLAREETQLKELEKLTFEQRRDAIQTVVGTDNELGTLLNENNLAKQRLLALGKDYAPEHPEYQKAKILAEETAKRINQRVDGVMIGLAARVNTLLITVKNLKVELDQTRETDMKNAELSRPYYEAKQRLEELTRFRTMINMKIASGKIEELPGSTMVEIIDRAQPAFRPVRPNKPLNLFIGAFAGMLLGAMAGGAAAWGKGRARSKTPKPVTAV